MQPLPELAIEANLCEICTLDSCDDCPYDNSYADFWTTFYKERRHNASSLVEATGQARLDYPCVL